MKLWFFSSLLGSALGSNVLAWPPAFEENITCTLPDDYEFRKTGILALGVIGFNCVLYSSVGVNASPETGNITGTFGSFYTQSFFETPPTLFLSSYDAASSWSGGLDPIAANISGTSSFSALEFQSITGKYGNGSLATMNLADLTWVMGNIQQEGDLSYVTFTGTSGNTSVKIDLCVSKVLGRLNWGADISPTAMKTRFTVSGFLGGPVTELDLTMVLATATVNVSATAQTAGTEAFQLVRRGAKRMAHSVTFEGAFEVNCDGVNKPVVFTTVNGSIGDLIGPAIKLQVESLVDYHTDVHLITAKFAAGKETDVWVWDPTIASGVPPERVPPTSSGLTGGEIFGIVFGCLVAVGLTFYCYRRYQSTRLRKAEHTALAHEGQKTYI